MMRYLAPALIVVALLLQFHGPNGEPLYISNAEIVAMSQPDVCDKRAGAAVMTTMGSFCVRESLAEALTKYYSSDPLPPTVLPSDPRVR
jgi:hypothetical protein